MSKKSRNQSNRKVGFAYYIREGLSSVFVHGFTSLAAMLVIAACLMITGTFALVAYNLDLQIQELAGQSEIVVYIDETVSREDAQALGKKIRALDNVKSAEFITKEQLFEDYLDSLGDDAYVMEELRDDNPLRDSYQIAMDEHAGQTFPDKIAEAGLAVALISAFLAHARPPFSCSSKWSRSSMLKTVSRGISSSGRLSSRTGASSPASSAWASTATPSCWAMT